MPMRVIGMLLGIPEEDQQAVRQHGDSKLRRQPGMPQDYSQFASGGANGLRMGADVAVRWGRNEGPTREVQESRDA
jgi:hypothetical protein